jgi:hypothetical protein
MRAGCGKCGYEDWADATRMMTSFQDAIAIASLLIPHLAQGMVRGNPPLRLAVRKYPPLSKNRPRIADPPAESAGKVNHQPFAVARFFQQTARFPPAGPFR